METTNPKMGVEFKLKPIVDRERALYQQAYTEGLLKGYELVDEFVKTHTQPMYITFPVDRVRELLQEIGNMAGSPLPDWMSSQVSKEILLTRLFKISEKVQEALKCSPPIKEGL